MLSTGNLQRLGLARAFLHEPELVLLDEPANGLDPAGVVEVRDLLVAEARERGLTIFMSSHILAEVDRLATASASYTTAAWSRSLTRASSNAAADVGSLWMRGPGQGRRGPWSGRL